MPSAVWSFVTAAPVDPVRRVGVALDELAELDRAGSAAAGAKAGGFLLRQSTATIVPKPSVAIPSGTRCALVTFIGVSP